MINITKNDIVFNFTGVALNNAVKSALRDSALKLLDISGIDESKAVQVTTKTNPHLLFSKFVLMHILKCRDLEFDEAYVNSAYVFYQNRTNEDLKKHFYKFVGVDESSIEFRNLYLTKTPQGIGPFLVQLHSMRAITLPTSFNWPMAITPGSKPRKRLEIGKYFSSELLAFLRTFESQNEEATDPAFEAVSPTKSRREWFGSFGTKLLLATGWHEPQDINIQELLELQEAKSLTGSSTDAVLPFKALTDVLWRKYGQTMPFSPLDWDAAIRGKIRTPHPDLLSKMAAIPANKIVGEEFEYVRNFNPSDAYPETMKKLKALPGLSFDIRNAFRQWLIIEELYLRKIKREEYRPLKKAIGYLNLYLFFYLPYWFEKHPDTRIKYPNAPSGLFGSLFVSRLVPPDGPSPKTLMEMMDAFHLGREWNNNAYYSTLKQIQLFFKFVERCSDEVDGCQGFRQPISQDDFPSTSRPRGTNKYPIPRRLIVVMLDYIKTLLEYSRIITDKIIEGELESEIFRNLTNTFGGVIDTFKLSGIVGFVPLIIHKDRLIPLQFIPNCLNINNTDAIKPRGSSKAVYVPHPHALNQILVAVLTGIRHNHIQWLDARTFDKSVVDDDIDFSLLHVNTDKRMDSPWEPHVNMAVIHCLRSQMEWRNRFDEPGFQHLHFYNNNPKTKWERILPLFSFAIDGKPHSDTVYEDVWKNLLSGLQGLVRELGETALKQFCSLEPPGVAFNDVQKLKKKKEFGERDDVNARGIGNNRRAPFCELGVKSKITPHSTRVTVVSESMTFLPADVIGKYITGQSVATVHHYYVPNPEDIRDANLHQRNDIKERFTAVKSGMRAEVDFSRSKYIRADEVNSNLSRSLRENLKETIDAYGCISISCDAGELNGRDLLLETGATNAAENKTEICPYGNVCPRDVLKLIGRAKRCGLCPVAVRSIDHLQAVSAKVKQMSEVLDELTNRLEAEIKSSLRQFTDEEFDQLEDERSLIAAELAGWRLSEEVLYQVKNRVLAGLDSRRWVVQKPEAIERDLRKVAAPTNLTAYTLTRLEECVAYPTLESPQIRARFDMMRRQLLARSGYMQDALSTHIPLDPTGEFAGILRSIVEANGLTRDDIVSLLEGDQHLLKLPTKSLLLLEGDI